MSGCDEKGFGTSSTAPSTSSTNPATSSDTNTDPRKSRRTSSSNRYEIQLDLTNETLFKSSTVENSYKFNLLNQLHCILKCVSRTLRHNSLPRTISPCAGMMVSTSHPPLLSLPQVMNLAISLKLSFLSLFSIRFM